MQETHRIFAMSDKPTKSKKKERMLWLDVAKAYGILFVFYIHLFERTVYNDLQIGFLEIKFLGSFLIAIFCFMSGYFAKDKLSDFRNFSLRCFNRLVIPTYFFNLVSFVVLILISLFYTGPLIREMNLPMIVKLGGVITAGIPFFNGPTWFLIMLFSIQIIYFFLSSITNNNTKLIISMLMFSIAGYLLAPVFEYAMTSISKYFMIIKYFWYIPSAFTGIVFFLSGILVRRTSIIGVFNSRKKILLGLFISLALTLLTFNLNDFANSSHYKTVYVNRLVYGNYFYCYFTSFTGIAFVIFLSMLTKPAKIILYYGQSTLVLLGLNGFFYHFINIPLYELVIRHFHDLNYFVLQLICITIVLLQMALCYPFIAIVNRALSVLEKYFTAFIQNTLYAGKNLINGVRG